MTRPDFEFKPLSDAHCVQNSKCYDHPILLDRRRFKYTRHIPERRKSLEKNIGKSGNEFEDFNRSMRVIPRLKV